MPGSPGYDLHQARDASLQIAKPEHKIETGAPELPNRRGERRAGSAGQRMQIIQVGDHAVRHCQAESARRTGSECVDRLIQVRLA